MKQKAGFGELLVGEQVKIPGGWPDPENHSKPTEKEHQVKHFAKDKPPDLPPEKSVMQVMKQQLEPDMEQQTGLKSGKEYIKAIVVILLI